MSQAVSATVTSVDQRLQNSQRSNRGRRSQQSLQRNKNPDSTRSITSQGPSMHLLEEDNINNRALTIDRKKTIQEDNTPNARYPSGLVRSPYPSKLSSTESVYQDASDSVNLSLNSKLTTIDADLAGDRSDNISEDLCFICAGPVVYYSLQPCNNRYCHVCSLRLRALYKTPQCAFCKTDHERVIFTSDAEKRFEDFDRKDLPKEDTKLGVWFESQQCLADTILLLQFNCPDGDCDIRCNGWSDLKNHVKEVHSLLLCNMCVHNKKVFTHEHTLYTQKELNEHYDRGEPIKDTEMTGFKGHPYCEFCSKSYYDDDALYGHLKITHERCHVCDQLHAGQHLGGPDRPFYFRNYIELEKHFRRDHYPCMDPECVEKKFVVFGSDIDLKAHQLQEHNGGGNSRENREMRRVAVEFQYHYPPGWSGGRGRGRGRAGQRSDGDREHSRQNHRSNGPTRDEQTLLRAQQEQREELSRREAAVSPAAPVTQVPRLKPAEAFPALGSASASSSIPSWTVRKTPTSQSNPGVSSTPQARAVTSASISPIAATPLPEEVRVRHLAVLDRAATALGGDEGKIRQFQSQVTSYRRSDISAADLTERLNELFNMKMDELGKIVSSIADLLRSDNEEKSRNLLAAWNNWKVQNQANNDPIPAYASSITSQFQRSKVLQLKKSTAVSNNRTVLRTQSAWKKLESSKPSAASATSSSLIIAQQRLDNMTLRNAPQTTDVVAVPWAVSPDSRTPAPRPVFGGTNPTPVSQSSSFQSLPVNRGPSDEDFPSLPAKAPRPRLANLNAGAVPPRAVVGWGEVAPPVASEASSVREELSKEKKKKKGKTVLFHVG